MWKKIVISPWIYFRCIFFFADSWTPTSRFSQAMRNFWTLLNQSEEKATQVSLQNISSFETRLRRIPLHGVPWMGQVPHTLPPADWESAIRVFSIFWVLNNRPSRLLPCPTRLWHYPKPRGWMVAVVWEFHDQWQLSEIWPSVQVGNLQAF